MSPLRVEVFNPSFNRWIESGQIKPGDRLGSISDNRPDGVRDIYMFGCAADDSKSIIYRSGLGGDIDLDPITRAVFPDLSRLKVVKEIKKGESFEITVFRTDINVQPRRVRFTHR